MHLKESKSLDFGLIWLNPVFWLEIKKKVLIISKIICQNK